jgi:hypothetical protein
LTPTSGRIKKKSWLPAKHDKQKPEDGQGGAKAWIAGLREHVPYDITPLLKGERVCIHTQSEKCEEFTDCVSGP